MSTSWGCTTFIQSTPGWLLHHIWPWPGYSARQVISSYSVLHPYDTYWTGSCPTTLYNTLALGFDHWKVTCDSPSLCRGEKQFNLWSYQFNFPDMTALQKDKQKPCFFEYKLYYFKSNSFKNKCMETSWLAFGKPRDAHVCFRGRGVFFR